MKANIVITDVEANREISEASQNSQSESRRIQRVTSVLLRDKENEQCYYPKVVSFGPYHHGEEKLKFVEYFKPKVIQWIVSKSGKPKDDFYRKVMEMIKDARSCYVEGSTVEYNDDKFSEMMLLDGCFILCIIFDCCPNDQLHKANDMLIRLDVLTVSIINADMFLLENQIPFHVIEVLMDLMLGENIRKELINAFIDWKSSVIIPKKQEVKDEKQPTVHLLDALRTIKLWKYEVHRTRRVPLPKPDVKELYHSFRSVTELKAKGIRVKPTDTAYFHDIKFISYWFYGQLYLSFFTIGPLTKSVLLNYIAYEVCLRDIEMISHVALMKSLIDHPNDVKELRSKRILFMLGSDEEIVKLFKDINIYDATNLTRYVEVKDSVQKNYNSKPTTWTAELYSTYFSSPWKTIALLGGIFVLGSTVLQTYYSWRAISKK